MKELLVCGILIVILQTMRLGWEIYCVLKFIRELQQELIRERESHEEKEDKINKIKRFLRPIQLSPEESKIHGDTIAQFFA